VHRSLPRVFPRGDFGVRGGESGPAVCYTIQGTHAEFQRDDTMITTVVGDYPKTPNLPRPAKLRRAIMRHQKGEISSKDFAQVEDEVTLEVIQEQTDAGLDLITDGHIRREDPQTYFAARLGGFEIDGLIRYFDTNTYYRQPVAKGPVSWKMPISTRDWEFAKKNSPKPVKAVVIGPYTLAKQSKNEEYRDLDSFVMSCAEALSMECQALAAAGCRHIQLDEPAILRNKQDFRIFFKAVDMTFWGINHVKKAVYTYFGDVSDIYPEILNLPVDIIGLDFVQGGKNCEVVRTAPFHKELGFGIVDARNTKLEKPDDLRKAVDKILKVVPADRLHVNPSCGLEFLPRERAQEKLANMVKAANMFA
ncbi:MAG: hypothetical protein ACREJQ_07190, partial [bacterium]